ncbi:MAG: hypothetical protein M3439_01450, partial [Chloroflexota bacterium]|nr:hypothetical protein [Chloroflexota bacterium]
MSAAERNRRVTELMDEAFQHAAIQPPVLPADIARDLDIVFGTVVRGFREILLVIVIARMLNPEYRASTRFYPANPRALYEGPIRSALRDRGIPHGKSGPLNVAKATEGIDSQWAARRRAAAVAERVVALVSYIESLSSAELWSFSIALHARFIAEARRVAALDVIADPETAIPFLAQACQRFIIEAPDAGNTPQRIIGLLLQSLHDTVQTGIRVAGVDDRASVTTTTSKKLGDLAEEQPDGTVVRAYEITTKPFGQARVTE